MSIDRYVYIVIAAAVSCSLASCAWEKHWTPLEPSTADRPETGLQGQVPLSDQASGRSKLGYQKGMELIGQQSIRDRGSNLQLATYGHCAYVGSGTVEPVHPLEGIAVLDVRNPARPELVRLVSSPAGYSSWEGLEANRESGILVSFVTSRTNPLRVKPPAWDPILNVAFADAFEVYDVSSDCEQPRWLATVNTREVLSGGLHGLKLSADGKTAYISSLQAGASKDDPNQTTLVAYDLSNPGRPTLLAKWKWSDDPRETIDYGFHDGTISPDGATLYWGTAPMFSRRSPSDVSKVMVQAFDVRSIRDRHARAEFKLLGAFQFQDCGGISAHGAQYARIDGRPYLIAGGECPGVQLHVIDVSEPASMRLVSTYSTESSDPANAERVAPDKAGYAAHYFGVDDADRATTLFVTWFSSGLRVLDIRNPKRLQEVAYLNPPAHAKTVFCSFQCTSTHEVSVSDVRYEAASGTIWFVGWNGGFYVAQLTSSAGPNGLGSTRRRQKKVTGGGL